MLKTANKHPQNTESEFWNLIFSAKTAPVPQNSQALSQRTCFGVKHSVNFLH